jgi:hypothetical protein
MTDPLEKILAQLRNTHDQSCKHYAAANRKAIEVIRRDRRIEDQSLSGLDTPFSDKGEAKRKAAEELVGKLFKPELIEQAKRPYVAKRYPKVPPRKKPKS